MALEQVGRREGGREGGRVYLEDAFHDVLALQTINFTGLGVVKVGIRPSLLPFFPLALALALRLGLHFAGLFRGVGDRGGGGGGGGGGGIGQGGVVEKGEHTRTRRVNGCLLIKAL